MSISGISLPGMQLAALVIMVSSVVVHVALALAIFRDSEKLHSETAEMPQFVGPVVWGLAVLISGVVGATAYWVIHYSNLRADKN
ncbi:hypothetical protein MNKW57_12890 [Biformimicrobium ophioploci]|uniref:Cardiolipin synthase N-terminal domain-containing protein n=1 Tax=Biformimicrobium ophioploci TaxID=3036711 RepID=A0ABQ6LXZ9_9GAMM|nr:hypothetical protein MNKW57_12890 [Microbulbifer sp. NKW57]